MLAKRKVVSSNRKRDRYHYSDDNYEKISKNVYYKTYKREFTLSGNTEDWFEEEKKSH